MNTQPEALRLAEMFDSLKLTVIGAQNALPMEEAAAELRRLHELNQELVEALELLRGDKATPAGLSTGYIEEVIREIVDQAIAKARGTE